MNLSFTLQRLGKLGQNRSESLQAWCHFEIVAQRSFRIKSIEEQ
jgi:hypothetical protein